MEQLKFTEVVFQEKDGVKKDRLVVDENGYYTINLGALNSFNSAGEFYTASKATELFESSSVLMRRIQSGSLYMELGHPKRQPGMTDEDFYRRILTIEETNVCGHISEVTLDFNYGKKNPILNNPDLIAIVGKVKPAGPHAETLRISLENPKQNTAASIRGITENKYSNGRMNRTLTNIITWDHVIEPGIAIANKATTAALEAVRLRQARMAAMECVDVTINRGMLMKVLNEKNNHLATESGILLMNDIRSCLSRPTQATRLSSW